MSTEFYNNVELCINDRPIGTVACLSISITNQQGYRDMHFRLENVEIDSSKLEDNEEDELFKDDGLTIKDFKFTLKCLSDPENIWPEILVKSLSIDEYRCINDKILLNSWYLHHKKEGDYVPDQYHYHTPLVYHDTSTFNYNSTNLSWYSSTTTTSSTTGDFYTYYVSNSD